MFGDLRDCKLCGHAFAPSELANTRLAELYTERYFRGEEYRDYLSERNIIELNFRSRLRVLRRFLDLHRHRRLFEVGCAYGFFLHAARNDFVSVSGIDVCEAAVRYAVERLGLDAVCGDLLEQDLNGQEFDVVCMWDTIEHLARPDLYVEKLTGHMRTGALVVRSRRVTSEASTQA